MPNKTVINNWDVQTIQPNAFPASSEIPYRNKILAIKTGKNPKPPLVKVIVKPPITKATSTVPMSIELVASNEKIIK